MHAARQLVGLLLAPRRAQELFQAARRLEGVRMAEPEGALPALHREPQERFGLL